MTSARSARNAAGSLPEAVEVEVDDHDLDERIVCDRCGEPYLIAGRGRQRRLQPNHQPSCAFYRPPKPENAPVRPNRAPRVPPAQEAPTGRQRPPGYIPPENRRCGPPGKTPTTGDDHDDRTTTHDIARLADFLFGPRPSKGTP